jgi:hypothetical protein
MLNKKVSIFSKYYKVQKGAERLLLWFGKYFNFDYSNTKNMTVVIDKNNLKQLSKILAEKLGESKAPGNLSNHFGKLKRNIDGLDYQIEMRKNED